VILREVDVKDFAILRGPISVRFDEGINVVYGDNETGKSTLLAAIDWALTRRAKISGKDLKAIVPRDGGVPEVSVRFDRDGRSFRVTKRFKGASGTTRLVVEDGDGRAVEDLSGDDAESRLREELGFRVAGRGTPKKEDLHVWPLVRVEQGRSGVAPSNDLNEQSRGRLSDCLARESGEILSGPGAEKLLDSVREAASVYFTPNGKPARTDSSPLHKAGIELEAAQRELDELEKRLAEHERSIGDYARLELETRQLEKQIPEFRESSRSAHETMVEIDSRRKNLDTARSKRAVGEADEKAASEKRDQRRRLREDSDGAKKKQETADSELERAVERLKMHERGRAGLDDGVKSAEAADRQLSLIVRCLRSHVDLLRAREQRALQAERLETARREEAGIRECKRKAARLKVSDERLERLEALQKAADSARVRLEAASAAVEVRALRDTTIDVDGESQSVSSGDTTRLDVADRTTLRIGDVAEVVITPAGADLLALRRADETARRDLDEALSEAEVTSTPEARRVRDEHLDLARELLSREERLELAASEGADALEVAVAELESRIEDLESRADAEEGADALPSTETEVAASLRDREEDREKAREQLQGAQARLAEFEKDRVRLQEKRNAALRDRDTAAQTLVERDGRLRADVDESGEDIELNQALELYRKRVTESREEESRLAKLLDELHPDDVKDEAERAETAFESARAELVQKERERDILKDRLQRSELVGVHEDIGDVAGRIGELEAEVDRRTEHARALKLLVDTLESCRDEARRAFLAPLEKEVAPLLELFESDANVRFDETFTLRELSRKDSGIDSFDALSGGAKEQFATIVRLAMAKVIAGDGTLPVLLDDALVSTDDGRFDRFVRVLKRASRNLQIILCTCHWMRYRKLGVPTERATDLARVVREASAERVD
jgi:DNA repair exonuclease SbcCD ATPase subunit